MRSSTVIDNMPATEKRRPIRLLHSHDQIAEARAAAEAGEEQWRAFIARISAEGWWPGEEEAR
jgi:hypothetical protein